MRNPTLQLKNSISDLPAPALQLCTQVGAYWKEDGSANVEVFNKAFSQLVPYSGDASCVHGTLLRASWRIYRDIYQNGGVNLINNIHDDSLEEGDDDYEPPCYEFDTFYAIFFKHLDRWLPTEHEPCLADVKRSVLAGCYHCGIELDHLLDRVLHTIQTTDNMAVSTLNTPA